MSDQLLTAIVRSCFWLNNCTKIVLRYSKTFICYFYAKSQWCGNKRFKIAGFSISLILGFFYICDWFQQTFVFFAFISFVFFGVDSFGFFEFIPSILLWATFSIRLQPLKCWLLFTALSTTTKVRSFFAHILSLNLKTITVRKHSTNWYVNKTSCNLSHSCFKLFFEWVVYSNGSQMRNSFLHREMHSKNVQLQTLFFSKWPAYMNKQFCWRVEIKVRFAFNTTAAIVVSTA